MPTVSRFDQVFNPETQVAFGMDRDGHKMSFVAGIYADQTITEVAFSRRFPERYRVKRHIRTPSGMQAYGSYNLYLSVSALGNEARTAKQTTQFCADCSGVVSPNQYGSYRRPDGGYICRRCNETYVNCRSCGVRRSTRTMTYGADGNYHCPSCYESRTTPCAGGCEMRLWPGRGGYSITGEDAAVYCYDCFFLNHFCCEGCSQNFHRRDRDRALYSSTGGSLCRTCANESETVGEDEPDQDYRQFGELIHSYSYRPRALFYGEGTKFGVELEVICSNNLQGDARRTLTALNSSMADEKHAYLKRDSSIGEGGFEIVTHPHSMQEQRKLWRPFFANKPLGMTSYKAGSCGMHVHIERRALSQMQLRRMLVFVNEPSNLQYVAAIAQRSHNSYAKLIKKNLTTRFSSDRYEALNTTNRSTVELRIFRGTVRQDRFYKNLDFAEALIEFCRVTGLEKLNAAEFLTFVQKRRSRWKYLHNFHIERGFYTGRPLSVVAPTKMVKATA